MPLPLPLSEPGPLLTYLSWLRGFDAKSADRVVAAVRTVLSTEEGAILLDLMEKSTKDFRVSILADPRALEARNAQSFMSLDLRRIMSDETEQLLQRQADAGARRRNSRAGT